jgi:hypothetical protein
MSGSMRRLSEELDHEIDYVAYPNGKFDLRVAHFARAVGYKMAFTEEQAPAELSPNIYQVARYVHTKYQQAWVDAYGLKALGRMPVKKKPDKYDTRRDTAGFGMKRL